MTETVPIESLPATELVACPGFSIREAGAVPR
jgi:hypothetical protein